MVSSRGQYFAHRGLWRQSDGLGNSRDALTAALSAGFSLETDIRDMLGAVVIEHDPPEGDRDHQQLESLILQTLPKLGQQQIIALNVKSDGLLKLLAVNGISELLDDINLFFFDMSVPETLRYSQARLPFAQRLSEYEPISQALELEWPTPPHAYWVDGFHTDWFLRKDGSELTRLAENNLVVIVSPELHGRDNQKLIEWFIRKRDSYPNLCVCTDAPEDFQID